MGVRALHEERTLAVVREAELQVGILDVAERYHQSLVDELEGDEGHLLELFLEVDTSGDLVLQQPEVEAMLLLLDPGATPEELSRYVVEINLELGPLSFSGFVDWWHQARNVPQSLVSQKGAVFIAGVKARAGGAWIGGLLG